MKISRSRRFSAVCALLVVAGGVTALALSGLETRWGSGAGSTSAADAPRSAASQARVTHNHTGAESKTGKGIALRLDDSISLAPAASTAPGANSDATSGGVDARAADDFVENDAIQPALNLRVPEKIDIAARPAARKQLGNDIRGSGPIAPRVALNTGAAAQPRPHVESFSLFNPDYGLRGFMKQGWINQRVAFQGGLGLDDDRTDKTRDDDFRDNIAVGMGLIVAF